MSDIIETTAPTQEIYKQWHRSGFLNIGLWPQVDRVTVEVGSIDTSNGQLRTATKCFIPTMPFLAYLHAEAHNLLLNTYPSFSSENEGLSFFGGKTEGNIHLARVFKITPWLVKGRDGKPDFIDPNARAFKCGHFEGSLAPQGAIKPDYNKPIKIDTIKVSKPQLAEMYQHLSTAVLVDKLYARLSSV